MNDLFKNFISKTRVGIITLFMRRASSIFFVFLMTGTAQAEPLDQEQVQHFIEYMVKAYQFDAAEMQDLFDNAQYSERVISAMERPAESLSWDKYRPIFLDPERIEQGREFWELHQYALQRAEHIYGIPAGIIVAIIGIETRYGKNTGSDRVIDALATLAFHFPRRASYFRDQLEQFLLLTREQELDPLSLQGSYAGAMGLPQFMPGSFRNYAVDFDEDGRVDIWNCPADAIGSVANYLKLHGWEEGALIAVPGQTTGDKYIELLSDNLRPAIMAEELAGHDVQTLAPIPAQQKVAVIKLEKTDGDEIWLGLKNFYVITRYNRSPLYAMAVLQLFDAISEKYNALPVAAKAD